jgi:hypothetical protein
LGYLELVLRPVDPDVIGRDPLPDEVQAEDPGAASRIAEGGLQLASATVVTAELSSPGVNVMITNFGDFGQFSRRKKIAFFFKPNVMINFSNI